jgi:KDO2-lipid IV(A) lauroyltransferase
LTVQEVKKKSGPKFRKEERHELRYQLSIGIAAVLSWFFFMVPAPLRNLFAEQSGLLFFRVSHGYRDSVLSNAKQVLGKEREDAQVRAVARSIFKNSALNFMDLLTLPRRSNQSLVRSTYVVRGEWSMIDDALATGRGIIFVTAHVGCFDFIGQSFVAHGLKLIIVTGRTTSRFIFDGVTWLRGTRGATFVEPTPSGVRNVIRALRRGECAVFVIDRDFFQNGYEVDFFDRRTTLPPGAVRIARDTGALVVPMFTRRVRRGHELRIYPPMEIAKTTDVAADVRRGLNQLIPILENGISSAVEQWVMFQNVWPDTPPDAVKIFPSGSPLESELLEKVASHLPEIKSGDGSEEPATR